MIYIFVSFLINLISALFKFNIEIYYVLFFHENIFS